jgi:hypothetical protein
MDLDHPPSHLVLHRHSSVVYVFQILSVDSLLSTLDNMIAIKSYIASVLSNILDKFANTYRK